MVVHKSRSWLSDLDRQPAGYKRPKSVKIDLELLRKLEDMVMSTGRFGSEEMSAWHEVLDIIEKARKK